MKRRRLRRRVARLYCESCYCRFGEQGIYGDGSRCRDARHPAASHYNPPPMFGLRDWWPAGLYEQASTSWGPANVDPWPELRAAIEKLDAAPRQELEIGRDLFAEAIEAGEIKWPPRRRGGNPS